jgi:hypothetical protein
MRLCTRTAVASLCLAVAVAVAVVLAAPRAARAEKLVIDDDTFVNIGVLVQPQLLFTQDAAPAGGWTSDIFLRRGRIILSGQVDSHIGFVLVTDQPNWGKNGEYGATMLIQDAVASYKFGPGLTVDAGFMLLPFLRNNYVSAGALHTIDFHANVIKFPISKAFRDMGIVVRGLLADDRIYYRAGIFNGIASRAGDPTTTPPTPELNGSDSPRFTGTVRFNVAGKEDAYALPGIYFAAAPIISVGVGLDYQNEAYGVDSKHLGFNVDAHMEYPLGADNELIASAAFLRYADYGAGVAHEEGDAFFLEAGFRYQVIEPILSYEWFDGENTLRQSTLRAGLNWWIQQHKYNLKAEVAFPSNEDPPGGSAANDVVATVQMQASF